jgi:formylglycine-generating enzyme required for sulfatase activity
VRGADGRLAIDGETAVVFVLIPSGSFVMGAQAADPSGPQYDPSASGHESPLRRMEIDACFLAKYEMDQGQWRRLTGSNPSTFVDGDSVAGERIDDRHPVESVSWSTCTAVLTRAGWLLPTEAQWEYAARADTTTIWWTGSDASSLQGAANICDRHAHEYEVIPSWRYEMAIDDGRYSHAPVGSYRANPFGLHDVCGNVMEWCRDLFAPYANARNPGDGFVLESDENRYVVRGGGYENNDASSVRSARRGGYRSDQTSQSLGVRPMRPIAD